MNCQHKDCNELYEYELHLNRSFVVFDANGNEVSEFDDSDMADKEFYCKVHLKALGNFLPDEEGDDDE